jgi:hypothetical protein
MTSSAAAMPMMIFGHSEKPLNRVTTLLSFMRVSYAAQAQRFVGLPPRLLRDPVEAAAPDRLDLDAPLRSRST